MLSVRAALVLVFVFSVWSPSVAMVIDDFTVGPVNLVRDAGVPVLFVQSGLDGAHVVGGGRDFELGGSGNDIQSAVIDTMTGQLTLGVSPSTTLGYLTLSYGSDAEPLNLDLTADGSDQFIIDFASGSHPGSLKLTSPGASQTGFIDPGPIFYSEFPSVDLTNISSITLSFSRSTGFVLNSIITTVPEPNAAVLLALGMLGVLTASRHRW